MTKEEAIEWLREMRDKYVYSDPYYIAIDTAIKSLSADVLDLEGLSAYGYSIKDILTFALACRKAEIHDCDLKMFAKSCEFAWETMQDELAKSIISATGERRTDGEQPDK